MKRATRLGLVVSSTLVFLGVLIAAPSPASAHDELVSSNPANASTVTAMPASILLTFEEPPAEGHTTVSVLAADGTDISSGPVVSNGSRISRGVRSGLGPGSYTVKYGVLSDDGHPVSGEVRFTVAGTVTTSAPVAATKSSGGSNTGWILWFVGGVAVLGVLFGAVRLFSPAPSTRVRG